MEDPYVIPNEYSYLQHLTDDEIETLNKLSNVSNNLKKTQDQNKKLENMTIKDIYENWSESHIQIIKELSKFSGKEYKKYFTDIDKTEEWWKGITLVAKDIFKIMTFDNRIIYVGITIILVAIMVFFISSSRT